MVFDEVIDFKGVEPDLVNRVLLMTPLQLTRDARLRIIMVTRRYPQNKKSVLSLLIVAGDQEKLEHYLDKIEGYPENSQGLTLRDFIPYCYKELGINL